MQQAFGKFDAALHASRESLYAFFGAIGKANSAENFFHAPFQRRSAQPVKMALMPKILVGCELRVDALRLEYNANLAAEARGLQCRIATHDDGTAAGRDHQGGKDAEKRGLPAAVWTE